MQRSQGVLDMEPYTTLFVYEIKGEVEDAGDRFKEDFLGCWLEGENSYLFFTQYKEHPVKSFISDTVHLEYLSETVLPYEDWEAGDKITPFNIHNFKFCPVWHECTAEKDEIVIRLDPGVMFGSGHHSTTRKCLEALWKIYQWDSPERILDVGTGTGILAITAAKLGGKEVLAVDNNNLAVETAKKNITINDVSNEVKVVYGDGENYLDWDADILCANVPFDILVTLLKGAPFYTKKWYVLSGPFGTQVQEVLRFLSKSSIHIVETIHEGFWFTVLGKRMI